MPMKVEKAPKFISVQLLFNPYKKLKWERKILNTVSLEKANRNCERT